jgi:hypothetical protein
MGEVSLKFRFDLLDLLDWLNLFGLTWEMCDVSNPGGMSTSSLQRPASEEAKIEK